MFFAPLLAGPIIRSSKHVQRRFTKRVIISDFTHPYDDRLKHRRLSFDTVVTYNIIKRSILPFDNF